MDGLIDGMNNRWMNGWYSEWIVAHTTRKSKGFHLQEIHNKHEQKSHWQYQELCTYMHVLMFPVDFY